MAKRRHTANLSKDPMKLTPLLILIPLATLTLGAQQQAPENSSITKAEMKADLFFLASDEMRGRLVGTPENRLAAEFIKSRFERAGLAPAGDGIPTADQQDIDAEIARLKERIAELEKIKLSAAKPQPDMNIYNR